MSYTWCTVYDIQTYLDEQSTIVVSDAGEGISGNYDETDAIRLENNVATKIKEYLAGAYNKSTIVTEPILVVIASQLTAAEIAFGRMASSFGSEISEWTDRLKNEAWAKLQIVFINQTLDTATTLNIPFWKRLFMSKSREKAIISNV